MTTDTTRTVLCRSLKPGDVARINGQWSTIVRVARYGTSNHSRILTFAPEGNPGGPVESGHLDNLAELEVKG